MVCRALLVFHAALTILVLAIGLTDPPHNTSHPPPHHHPTGQTCWFGTTRMWRRMCWGLLSLCAERNRTCFAQHLDHTFTASTCLQHCHVEVFQRRATRRPCGVVTGLIRGAEPQGHH